MPRNNKCPQCEKYVTWKDKKKDPLGYIHDHYGFIVPHNPKNFKLYGMEIYGPENMFLCCSKEDAFRFTYVVRHEPKIRLVK